MGGLESDEALPQAWTVEVKQTKNGRNDKVAIEKTEPEGLPPGWTKEVKVTKKGGKIRRDSFYTDPASGYIFHSMKDVRRYLETGEIGRLAKKPKDKNNDESDSEIAKTNSPAVAKQEKLEDDETTSGISDKSSKPCETTNRELITGDSLTNQINTRKEGKKICPSSVSLNKNNPDQAEEKTDSSKNKLVSTVAGGANQINRQSPETPGVSGKTKKEKYLNQPRRASKRLAGVQLDPIPELKATTRVTRSSVKEFNKMATNGEDSSSNQGHVSDVKSTNQGNQPVLAQNDKGSRNTENGCSTVNKSDCVNTLSSESATGGDHTKVEDVVTDVLITKCSMAFVSSEVKEQNGGKDCVSLDDLWQDPCIAFAIKTLTSASIEVDTNLNTIEPPPVPSNSVFKIVDPQLDTGMNASTVFTKPDERRESTIELPVVADVLADPCIEFAIKTLTGAIPLDHLQLQACMSTEISRKNGLETSKTVKCGSTMFTNQRHNVEERSRKRRK